jgi:hypothetical protein
MLYGPPNRRKTMSLYWITIFLRFHRKMDHGSDVDSYFDSDEDLSGDEEVMTRKIVWR